MMPGGRKISARLGWKRVGQEAHKKIILNVSKTFNQLHLSEQLRIHQSSLLNYLGEKVQFGRSGLQN